jgi:hypothetical protein
VGDADKVVATEASDELAREFTGTHSPEVVTILGMAIIDAPPSIVIR